MATWRWMLALILGAALGVVVVLPALLIPRIEPATPEVLEKANRELVARDLMGRIGRDFVADTPPSRTLDGSQVFYDIPLAYGDGLCRIRRYAFGHAIAAGLPFTRRDYPFEKLIVEDVYGVWAEPGSARATGADDDQACAKYRDFEHVISGEDGISISRVVNVLTRASREAQTGRVSFKVTCLDRRQPDTQIPCDGVALLRDTTAHDVRHVRNLSRGTDDIYASPRTSQIYRDSAQIDVGSVVHSCGKWEALTYDLTVNQVFGKTAATDGDLLAIDIYRDSIC